MTLWRAKNSSEAPFRPGTTGFKVRTTRKLTRENRDH